MQKYKPKIRNCNKFRYLALVDRVVQDLQPAQSVLWVLVALLDLAAHLRQVSHWIRVALKVQLVQKDLLGLALLLIPLHQVLPDHLDT